MSPSVGIEPSLRGAKQSDAYDVCESELSSWGSHSVRNKFSTVSFIQFEGITLNYCLELGGEKFRDKLKSTGTIHVQGRWVSYKFRS